MTMDTTKCVHCHKCRDNCAFLHKYNIDIGDTEKLKNLAFHCFLCGTCSRVCPVGIDGRGAVLNFRRELSESSGSGFDPKKYRMLLWEKKNYRFRNYRNAHTKSVLFPGCNFPSLYPETTAMLVRLLREKAGIGVAYDCCGKPIAELGLANDEQSIIAGINKRLKDAGTEEVIMVCPNCYSFLKDRLEVRVVSIYEKLTELGIGNAIPGDSPVFMPCPDREGGELLAQIEYDFADNQYERIEGVQCCGLGGNAGVLESELAQNMASGLKDKGTVYVYCASCAGKLKRDGVRDVRHILTEILGTHEDPDTGKSMVNRMLTKLK